MILVSKNKNNEQQYLMIDHKEEYMIRLIRDIKKYGLDKEVYALYSAPFAYNQEPIFMCEDYNYEEIDDIPSTRHFQVNRSLKQLFREAISKEFMFFIDSSVYVAPYEPDEDDEEEERFRLEGLYGSID